MGNAFCKKNEVDGAGAGAPGDEPAPPPSQSSAGGDARGAPQTPRASSFDANASDALVDAVVDGFMRDSTINSFYLPDFIERALYKNSLRLMIAVLNKTFQTVSVEFLGHRMTVRLETADAPVWPSSAPAPAPAPAPARA